MADFGQGFPTISLDFANRSEVRMVPAQFPEAEYRKKIQEVYDAIEKALSDVDPDLAECELANGVLTIVFSDRTRCILSGQPSVRQLWLALASLGTAYHFDFDSSTGRWMDDKGRGIELMSYLQKFLQEKTGEKIALL